ncbi:MAG: hypothetical protein IH991_07885 [Planctomycetes bacterium]|nr:hypothetical protein [Planctomycetota bacterium]
MRERWYFVRRSRAALAAVVLLIGGILVVPSIAATPAQGNADRWLRKSGFGLMFHYECFRNYDSARYNEIIDSFDVPQWADSVESTGAGHVIFVIGQHWGKYCAPNSAYEKLLGVKNGVWTSKRDLIMDIGLELKKRNIKLIVYMTARAPMRHYNVIKAMGDTLPKINGRTAGPDVDTMSHPRKVKGFVRSDDQINATNQIVRRVLFFRLCAGAPAFADGEKEVPDNALGRRIVLRIECALNLLTFVDNRRDPGIDIVRFTLQLFVGPLHRQSRENARAVGRAVQRPKTSTINGLMRPPRHRSDHLLESALSASWFWQ